MRQMKVWLPLVVASAVACGSPGPAAMTPAEAAAHVAEVQAWRDKHEVDYRRDWVSIAGLHQFKPGRNTAGSGSGHDIPLPAPVPASLGVFVLAGQAVRFEPDRRALAAVNLNGKPLAGPVDLRDDGGTRSDELTVGDVRMAVHVSGEHRSLRVRDPKGPLATGFLGFTWFPIDPAYRVTGRFVKDAEPRSLQVLNTFGDIDSYKTEGVIEFTLQGHKLSVRPFTTRPNRFYIVFKDASSGQETYEAARFLYSNLNPDGTTVLDFNEAYNPPCAFNPYTTCPIPLKESRLAVKILAGEKAYPVHVPPAVGGAGR
ncbi:MAG: DUF1684 domain-containing protein [Acidobacteria bacterium]|nr:MAG: DUF1684 domain-containing protein [Acidobacteriota bacterium]